MSVEEGRRTSAHRSPETDSSVLRASFPNDARRNCASLLSYRPTHTGSGARLNRWLQRVSKKESMQSEDGPTSLSAAFDWTRHARTARITRASFMHRDCGSIDDICRRLRRSSQIAKPRRRRVALTVSISAPPNVFRIQNLLHNAEKRTHLQTQRLMMTWDVCERDPVVSCGPLLVSVNG